MITIDGVLLMAQTFDIPLEDVIFKKGELALSGAGKLVRIPWLFSLLHYKQLSNPRSTPVWRRSCVADTQEKTSYGSDESSI